jgi:hypothetical protein
MRWLWWGRMTSHSRTAEREEERGLNLRTLVIASAASAAAALLTSRLWIAGTWLAAAMTPVIVTLVSEILNRPTDRIARSFTSDRGSLAAAGGAGRPAGPGADPLPDRAPMEPAAGAGRARPPAPGLGSEAPIRVYRAGETTSRSTRRAARAGVRGTGADPRARGADGRGREVGPGGGADSRGTEMGAGGGAGSRGKEMGAGGQGVGSRGIGMGAGSQGAGSRGTVPGAPGIPPAGRRPAARRRRIAYGAVFGTAAIAFVIAVAALTLPELVAGGSVGKNDGRTTLFGGKPSDDRGKERAPQDTTEEEQPPPEEEQQPTTPEEETTPPAEEPPPAEEAPPAEQAPPRQSPAPGEPLPETTPAPPAAQP